MLKNLFNDALRFLKFAFKLVFDFRDPRKQLLDLVLIFFVLSFLIARAWSVIIGNSIYFHGFQIHHFYFGMLILAIGGVMGLLFDYGRARRLAAILIGVGIGLFADEIGLLLNCTTSRRFCTYAFPDYLDLVGTIVLVIVIALLVIDFFQRKKKDR